MKNHFLTLFLGVMATALLFSCKHEAITATCDQSAFSYTTDIKPIIDAHCTSCHSETATVSNGYIYLENWVNLNDYVINSPETFIGDITHDAAYNPMPKGGNKMTDCEITKIKNWINAGAPNN